MKRFSISPYFADNAKRLLIAVGAVLVIGTLAFTLSRGGIPALSKSGPQGRMTVEVVDGFTDAPIEGATVVIPETGDKFTTDKNGKTAQFTLPILENSTYKSILRQPWGEVTVLVYKDGYIPYALFHTQVWENQARQGPRIYLFAPEYAQNDQPFSVIEGPQRIWVNELLKKYKPKA